MLKTIIAVFILFTFQSSLWAVTTPNLENTTKLYVATFNRAPDAAGLNYWVNDAELSLEDIAQSFFDQPETQEAYPSSSTNEDFVIAVYNNLFNREPESAGLDYWVEELESGRVEKSVFILAVINGAQDTELGNDATILENKTIIGLAFANAGFDDVELAKIIMYGITDEQIRVDFIMSKIDSNEITSTVWDNFDAFLHEKTAHSYYYSKESNVTQSIVPEIWYEPRGYADFNNDGILDIFNTRMTYLWNGPIEDISPSEYTIWLGQADGTWVKDGSLLSNPNDGCYHPRKILTDDFNNDNKPDIFTVCHGYDAEPFPGEKNTITLSQPDGSYVTKYTGEQIGFFHSGSTADVNNDGYPDVLITDNFDSVSSLYFLINQKDGTFISDYTRMPQGLGNKNFYTVEMVDINSDGYLDIIAGGHEWENAPTQVWINPGNYNFSTVNSTILPSVENEGVVLDFTITKDDGNTFLWIDRTSGGDGTFYESAVVQKVSWPQLESTIEYYERPGNWIMMLFPMMIDGEKVLTTDDKINYDVMIYR